MPPVDRGARDGRGAMTRRSAVLVAVALGVALSACNPVSTRTGYMGVPGGRRIDVLGHSIPTSARPQLRAELGASGLVAFDTENGRTIPQASMSIDRAVAAQPDVVVVAFGENELATQVSQAQLRRRVRATLDRLTALRCVVWVDIRDRATAWYRLDWAAQATSFNAWLPKEVLRRPNSHSTPWSEWARPHPEWFSADELHLSAAGRSAYAAFVAGSVNDRCGGPTASTPVGPATDPGTGASSPAPRESLPPVTPAEAPPDTDPSTAADLTPEGPPVSEPPVDDQVPSGSAERTD